MPPSSPVLFASGAAALAAGLGIYYAWSRSKGYIIAKLNYQSCSVPRSLLTTKKVYVERLETGTDTPMQGVEFEGTTVRVHNGRLHPELNLDDHGVAFGQHVCGDIDFYDDHQIITRYYPEVARCIKEVTGAKRVVCFDHNVRKTKWAHKGEERLKGGNVVQTPLQMVHGDYTVTSAPLRVEMLAQTPKTNDTLGSSLNGIPLIEPTEVSSLLSNRYQFINLWRSFAPEPVEDQPLAVCDGSSVPIQDLVTFEVRYTDRTGENYFSAHSSTHKWYYWPKMTRDEILLLKCWDSKGVDFLGYDFNTGKRISEPSCDAVKSTFSLHTAFTDPSTRPNINVNRSRSHSTEVDHDYSDLTDFSSQ